MYYSRKPDAPLPHDRTFIVNLADGTSLRIWASSQMVTVYQHRKLHEEPIYRATFMIAENPALATLYSNRMGWDIVGLISLMRSEIGKMTTITWNKDGVREFIATDTVPIPSQQHQSRQERRPMGQALELITVFIGEHPGCTRLQIARGIDRAKQPNVIVQIEWLVSRGYLARSHGTSAQGRLEFRYTLIEPFVDNGESEV